MSHCPQQPSAAIVRISEYHENGELKARYHYNALGQRIHKAVIQPDGSEQHTLFHYGQNGELLSEIQLDSIKASTNGQSQNIVWLQMRPVVALDSGQQASEANNNSQITWLHSDHLLTARVAIDSEQNLVWRWQSDAFGVGQAESLTAGDTVHNDESAFTFNLRFPGQYYDAENGLHYNYFRTYDPQQGRYTQSDPIGLMGGMNTFAYAYSSPTGFSDPFGLEVLLQTHPVVGIPGPSGEPLVSVNHAKITIIPEDQERWRKHDDFKDNVLPDGRVYATIGAGPGELFEGSKLLHLVSGINRVRDTELNHNVSSISIFDSDCYGPDEENNVIERIFRAEAAFSKKVPLFYDFFPKPYVGGYNSNSFISGLLNYLRIEAAQPAVSPGFGKPVPDNYFH